MMNIQKITALTKLKYHYDTFLKTLKDEFKPFLGESNNSPIIAGRLIVLLDVSSSMHTRDKLSQAQQGSQRFSEEMISAGFLVGIVKFATDAQEILMPTNNINELHNVINQLTASGSTNMADGIRLGMDRLVTFDGRRMLFLVTDGVPDDRDKALRMAEEAKQLGIEIHTHGTKDADEEFLKKIASVKEIVKTVQDHLLSEGIQDMARQIRRLPPPRLT